MQKSSETYLDAWKEETYARDVSKKYVNEAIAGLTRQYSVDLPLEHLLVDPEDRTPRY